jgi:hypothetical protein
MEGDHASMTKRSLCACKKKRKTSDLHCSCCAKKMIDAGVRLLLSVILLDDEEHVHELPTTTTSTEDEFADLILQEEVILHLLVILPTSRLILVCTGVADDIDGAQLWSWWGRMDEAITLEGDMHSLFLHFYDCFWGKLELS